MAIPASAFPQLQGLALAPLSAKNPRCERYTVEEDVFTPTDVVALMQALNEIGTPEAHEAFIATPLAFYAMLRIDEVLNVRICQLMLAGDLRADPLCVTPKVVNRDGSIWWGCRIWCLGSCARCAIRCACSALRRAHLSDQQRGIVSSIAA